MLLSTQAMRLVDDLRYSYRHVPLKKLLDVFPHTSEDDVGERHILGDEDLLRYLFGILAHLFEGHSEQCRELFTPTTPNLQFYLCRQIVRDTGEFTNARGCGVFASNIENKTHIAITLPKTTQA